MYPCSYVLDMTSHPLQLRVLYMHITISMLITYGALKALLKVVRVLYPYQLMGIQGPYYYTIVKQSSKFIILAEVDS